MLTDGLMREVLELDEQDKLRLVQLLIDDLKLASSVYEIYTPFGSDAAARQLQLMLETDHVESQLEIK